MRSLFETGIIQYFEDLTGTKRQRKEKFNLFCLLVLGHRSSPALMLRRTPSAPLGSQTCLSYTVSFPSSQTARGKPSLNRVCISLVLFLWRPLTNTLSGVRQLKVTQLVSWGPKLKPDLLNPKSVSLASSYPQIFLSHMKLRQRPVAANGLDLHFPSDYIAWKCQVGNPLHY